MKKSVVKTTIIVGVIALCAGVIVWIIGMSVIGWNFNRLDSANYTARSYTKSAENDLQRVEIDVQSFTVTVKSGGEFSFDYYEATGSEVSVTEDNGVLKIVERYDWNPFKSGLFNFGRLEHKYELTVPEGVSIDMRGNNCNAELSRIEQDRMEIIATNADISLTDCKIGELDIKSTSLDAKFDKCEIGDLSIDSTNTTVRVNDCNGNAFSADSTNLEVKMLRSLWLESMTVVGTNVTARVDDSNGARMKFDATNGDYHIIGVAVHTLDVQATNLNAEIKIQGDPADYSVISEGRNLPGSRTGATDKCVKIKGTNNNVSLKWIAE